MKKVLELYFLHQFSESRKHSFISNTSVAYMVYMNRNGHIATVLTPLQSDAPQYYHSNDASKYSSKPPTFFGENTPLKSV